MKIIGVAYSMTNDAESNEIIAFSQHCDGTLTRMAAYSTGGSGTGEQIVDPLGSQGSIIVSCDGCFLFAVNAGSNSISSFRIRHGSLNLVDVEPSNGVRPNSLASFNNLLYVTNAGDPPNNIASNVTGFRVRRDGTLIPIPGSTKPLSTVNAQPSCVVFSPHGHKIVVSEQNTNTLSTFRVNSDGTLTGPAVNSSSGIAPFGSVFLCRGLLLVAEAGSGALSSYTANPDGTLNVISASVKNFQTATCWVSASPCERFAYTSNTGSHTIATYRINKDGTLAVDNVEYSTRNGTGAPIDSAVNNCRCFLYVLNGNEGSISVFRIEKDGSLTLLQVLTDTGLPELGAQGMAVFS